MDKNTLLVILNLPFVLFGYTKAVVLYGTSKISWASLILRLIFWSLIMAGLILAQPIYSHLSDVGLTNSTPLTLFDVIEVTGIIFCLTLIMRLYTRTYDQEQRLALLHCNLSLDSSASVRNVLRTGSKGDTDQQQK